MNSATNCPALPATVYALARNTFARCCPATPAQAYRLGHGEYAWWLTQTCEVA